MADQHEDLPDFAEIAHRLRAGTIVPFFGAGASIACGLPSAGSLAASLVTASHFPDADRMGDLAHVASYCAQTGGDNVTLHNTIRDALNVNASPGRLHNLLARIEFQETRLFVTTNYDTLVEDALAPRAPWLVVDRGTPGLVYCKAYGDLTWEEVESKKLGYTITDRQRPVVLKLHGHFDRQNRDNDSFLITEEHYVDFLGRGDGTQIPHALASAMRQRSFLFLGYGLRDWNVRVLLHKLAQSRPRGGRIKSWAVVRQPSLSESSLWEAQDVSMHDIDLDRFAFFLEDQL